jgi:hypothetical protein
MHRPLVRSVPSPGFVHCWFVPLWQSKMVSCWPSFHVGASMHLLEWAPMSRPPPPPPPVVVRLRP